MAQLKQQEFASKTGDELRTCIASREAERARLQRESTETSAALAITSDPSRREKLAATASFIAKELRDIEAIITTLRAKVVNAARDVRR
jgi:hypothetical protein